jgi:uncharacterized protein (DUF2249 family)
MSLSVTTLDIQSLIPHNRHPLVFAVFQSTLPGASFQIVNNHDPVPLFNQLNHHFPGEFKLNYLEQGPSVWRIEVRREANEEVEAGSSCCGGCGCG